MTVAQPPVVPDSRHSDWGSRVKVAVVGVAVVALGLLVGAAFLPRWWAHFVGDQAGGSIVAGIALGLFYGFFFTGLPVLLLLWAFRKQRPWQAWVMSLAAAILLALPNLLTLGVVIGRGNAAHAGERTLDVEAPGFRGSSLAGALTLLLALVLLQYLLASRRRTRQQLERLREELRAREQEPPEPKDTPPEPQSTSG